MGFKPTPGLIRDDDGVMRCWWGASTPDYIAYHDDEWGMPVVDDHRLFEKLCLEGFQSGLSWLTILRKRSGFRRAFANFDPARVAQFGDEDVARLLNDQSIVRHRGKIESTINNAKRALELIDEHGSISAYVWRWEPPAEERPLIMTRAALGTLNKTPTSTAMSKDLKRRGWSFLGPTTVYAFLQAMGIVNDHLEGCHVRKRCTLARQRTRRSQ